MTTAGIAYRRTAGSLPARFRPQHPRQVTRKEIVHALRTAHAELGEPFTIARYDAWVRRQAAEYAAREEQIRFPLRRSVTRMFGTWQAAITEALGDRAGSLAVTGYRHRATPTRAQNRVAVLPRRTRTQPEDQRVRALAPRPGRIDRVHRLAALRSHHPRPLRQRQVDNHLCTPARRRPPR